MKKIVEACLSLLLAFSLMGCDNDNSKMHIQPSEHSEQGSVLVNMDKEKHDVILDYVVDGNATHFTIQMYHLFDGKWQITPSQGGVTLTKQQGQITLTFNHLSYGFILTLNDDEQMNYAQDGYLYQQGHAFGFVTLDESLAIEYGKEIPLVLQTESTNANWKMPVNWQAVFNDPTILSNVQDAYCITIRFGTEKSTPMPINN